MRRNAWKFIVPTTEQSYKVSAPCLDNHNFKEEELGTVGELSKVCSQMVLKCLYLTDLAVTKWTMACDKRSARLISCIHHTSDHRQHCHVGNTASALSIGFFFRTQMLLEALRTQKSTWGGNLCILGSQAFVPMSWMCKKQTSVSHSSTESEDTYLDGWYSRSRSLRYGY